MNHRVECGSCQFWVQHAKVKGTCHRYPPAPPGKPQKGYKADPWLSKFPATFSDDWCGEHTPVRMQDE